MKLLLLLSLPAAAFAASCGGEFSLCADGSCALTNRSCGRCAPGAYACPLSATACVAGLAAYESCPGLDGTYLDASLPEADRLAWLADNVPLEDMIGQLVNAAPAVDAVDLPAYNWLNDNEHGVKGTAHATVYPMGASLGASWSVDLAWRVGAAIGNESRATHNGLADKSGNACGSTSTGEVVANGCGITLYAPNVNLVRDPRWGRAEEVYGEDPHLTAELAVGMVTGLQGNAEGSTSGPGGGPLVTGACCKHFAVYQNEDLPADRMVLDANVSSRDLWETYLPVMKACVVRAKATHVMCSYNAVNGKPTCAHPELLNDVLRESWGFDGFVVSDYDAWSNLVTTHKYVSTWEEAAAAGINAGMDQEGGFGDYSPVDALPDAVRNGTVAAATVRRSFERLMRVRLRLGMFDPPASTAVYGEAYQCDYQCETAAKLALAREAAREGIVLFKNAGGALPLAKGARIALVGPQVDDWRVLLGAVNYAFEDGPDVAPVTIQKGLEAVANVSVAAGCDSVACAALVDVDGAKRLAAAADATVVVLGDSFGATDGWPLCRGTRDDGCESESHDRATIELPGEQVALVAALRAASARLVCVLVHGGAVALGGAADDCDAVVDLWVPGQMGGAALADVLFGDYSPAGRSPITMYAATSDLPPMGVFDEYAGESSNGTTYRYYAGPAPTYAFGDGLSYASFSYAWAAAPPTTVDACGAIRLRVAVTNTGSVASDEVVQVYARVPDATVPAPAIRLVAFDRVRAIAPGATATVELVVAPESHAVVYPVADSVYVERRAVEQGALVLSVGGSQPGRGATLAATVAVASTTLLADC